jgi:hypothetical protein
MSKDCCNNVSGCKPSLPTLIILILILLQFGGNNFLGGNNYAGGGKSHEGIDNGILFIIALFYLSCCSPCKTSC